MSNANRLSNTTRGTLQNVPSVFQNLILQTAEGNNRYVG
jgi:hypothetical protein